MGAAGVTEGVTRSALAGQQGRGQGVTAAPGALGTALRPCRAVKARGPGRSAGKHSRGEARTRGSGCQWDKVPPFVFRYCGSHHFYTEVPDKGTVPGLTVPEITSQIIL